MGTRKGWSSHIPPSSRLRPGSRSGQGVKSYFWCRSRGQGQDLNSVERQDAIEEGEAMWSIGTVKRSRAFCSAVKQQNCQSKYLDPGLSYMYDYSAYGSDQPLTRRQCRHEVPTVLVSKL